MHVYTHTHTLIQVGPSSILWVVSSGLPFVHRHTHTHLKRNESQNAVFWSWGELVHYLEIFIDIDVFPCKRNTQRKLILLFLYLKTWWSLNYY